MGKFSSYRVIQCFTSQITTIFDYVYVAAWVAGLPSSLCFDTSIRAARKKKVGGFIINGAFPSGLNFLRQSVRNEVADLVLEGRLPLLCEISV